MADTRDVVRAQYEEWAYPLPIPDLAEAVAGGYFDHVDPALIRRKIWPRNVEPDALEILVAGCGTNQAAHLAFKNPECHVVGIDLSEASLDHQRFLKEKHDLANLEVRQLRVEDAADLGQSFDLVISTGVLMCLPDPDRGLRSLRGVLATPHGAMIVMLYGRYGRLGVYLLQDALRLLGSEQDKAGLEMTRHLIETVPDSHPVHRYIESVVDINYDAGLVDSFLHRADRAHTVPEVLRFARDNGLKFQSWLDNLDYSLSAHVAAEDDLLRQRAEMLDEAERWELVELLWLSPRIHTFVLCHLDRPESDYALDFSGDGWLAYVPSLRSPMAVLVSQVLTSHSMDDQASDASVTIERRWFTVSLGQFGALALNLIDGARSIGQIVAAAGEAIGGDASGHLETAREFFRQMAEWDHLLFEIR